MGQLRFHIPTPHLYDPLYWNTAYVSGIEGIPWAGKSRIEKDLFTIERGIDESGRLSLVWPTRECGPIVLTTSSLRSDESVYSLVLELSRGTLHRIRGRSQDWQKIGLKLPEAFSQPANEALNRFIEATTSQSDREKCHRLAQEAIEYCMASIRPLARAFISQSLQFRHQQETRLSTLLGMRMVATDDWVKNRDHLLPAMNMGCISLEWGKIESDSGHVNYDLFDEQIEWAHANQLRVFAGPLISLQPHAMPNWLYLLSDFDALLKAACEFTERTVKRYQGRIHLWCAAAGLNGPNDLKLTDEQILRLAVGVIQTVRRTDSRTPVVLALDMPWAEYLGQKEDAISPIHFADALIRADLGLSGLALEMNLDYWPGGSLPRDLIDISDLIDTWSMLGLPLMAILSTPNSLQKDPRVNSRYGLVSHWKHPELPLSPASDKCAGMPPNGLDIIQLLLAKPNIHGIIWNQPSDAIAHAFPNSGLFGPDGQPRPILDAIGRLRQQHIH